MKRIVCLLMLVMVSVSLAQDPPVTEALNLMNAGKYKEALQSIAKSTATMTRDSDRDQQYQLLMLKGECLLQTGSYGAATTAFDAAAKSATDAKQIAPARANALLIRAAQAGKYRPRTGNAQPIDIVPIATRPAAMAAMRSDMARQIKPQLDRALNGNTLPPMFEVLPKLLDIGFLEYTADGSAPNTRADLQQLGGQARELMNSELRRISQQTRVIENNAGSSWDGNTRGLYSTERDALKNNATYLKQIEQTAREARRRAIELGFDGKAWEPVIADAADLADRTNALVEFVP